MTGQEVFHATEQLIRAGEQSLQGHALQGHADERGRRATDVGDIRIDGGRSPTAASCSGKPTRHSATLNGRGTSHNAPHRPRSPQPKTYSE